MLNILKILCLLILSIWMISSCTRDKSDLPQPQNGGSNDTLITCDSIVVCDSIIIICDSLAPFTCDTTFINCNTVSVCDTLTACDTASVTYAVDIEPIISVKCAIPNCHGTGFALGGVTLDTHAKVKAKADDGRLQARAIDGTPTPMPPGSPLSASEKAAIQNWIDKGACP